jgi:hypothetical protein
MNTSELNPNTVIRLATDEEAFEADCAIRELSEYGLYKGQQEALNTLRVQLCQEMGLAIDRLLCEDDVVTPITVDAIFRDVIRIRGQVLVTEARTTRLKRCLRRYFQDMLADDAFDKKAADKKVG